MAKKYYEVMVRHYFLSQDGYDYMDGEYSCILHTRRSEAQREMKEALKHVGGLDEVFIEEMEN